MDPSSDDLHPAHGARFVFERMDDAGAVRYRLDVYLPERGHLHTVLGWDASGGASFEPPLADSWAQSEAIKLARVLHRDPKQRLTRWRGREPG